VKKYQRETASMGSLSNTGFVTNKKGENTKVERCKGHGPRGGEHFKKSTTKKRGGKEKERMALCLP